MATADIGMTAVYPAPESQIILSDENSLDANPDATTLSDDNTYAQQLKDEYNCQKEGEIENGSLQSPGEIENGSLQPPGDIVSQSGVLQYEAITIESTVDCLTSEENKFDGITAVAPAPVSLINLSDTNSCNEKQDSRSSTNVSDDNTHLQPPTSVNNDIANGETENGLHEHSENDTSQSESQEETDEENINEELPEEDMLLGMFHGRRFYLEDSSDEDVNERDSDYDTNNKERDIQKDPRVKEKFSFYSKFHGYDIRNRYGAEKVKSGLRVMRPPSWKPPDGYEYKDCRLIGTIFHVAKSGAVKVQWDISKEIENCVKKSNGQYELLVYDNAQIGVTHSHVQCDGCSEYPLRGIRWKCVNCPDFDLCSSCYMNDEHDINGHIFKRIQSENAKGVQMMSRIREDCFEDMTAAIGITEGTTVQLRSDDSCVGTVRKLVHKKIDVFRSDAKVKSKGIEVRYALGREGKCDLKFTKEGAGPVFYVDHLPVVSSESASPGLRVVRGPAWNENYKDDDGGLGYLGTMIKVHRKSTKNATTDDQSAENQKKSSEPKIVEVQWDNGNIRSYNLQNEILRMFDNGPIGVEHESYFCDICNSPGEYNECIKGFRWRCLECSDYDLCNKCYMEDKDDITHRFQRVSAPNNWEQHNSIFCRENSKKIQSYGIFEGAEVVELVAQDNDKTNSDKQTGTVKEICNCKIDNGRSDVEVHWSDRKESQTECISKHDFLDLVCCKENFCEYIYSDHLPTLGKDFRGYFEVDFLFDGSNTKKKIKVTIWRTNQQERKKTFKPSLFIIFADHPELDKENQQKEDKTDKLVDEVMEFAKKTRLPCQIAGRKIMFYGGSSSSVFIHYNTDKGVIEELVKKGFRQFERGDIEEEEDEIHYFKRMAEYAYGETVLPVIISLRKGGLRKSVMRSAAESRIPIIRLKKHTYDVAVLTPVKYANSKCSVQMTEHITDVKNPWSVKKSKSKFFDLGRYDKEDDPYEIEFISEGPADYKHNFDALICCLIIGVSMESKSQRKRIYGNYTDIYPNALSMYLLKEGKWKIPKEHIKKSFNQRSIEYIYEKDLASEFESGLWSDLQKDTNMAYISPRFTDHRESRGLFGYFMNTDSDSDSDDESEFEDIAFDNYDSEINMHEGRTSEKGSRLKVSISELYGLIFLALLQKEYWNGAKQLVETGCIRIHYILVGCVILENVAKNWRTAPLLQDRLKRLNQAFTQRASRILKCIYEADTKTEKDKQNQKRRQSNEKETETSNKVEMELGEHINHAGRLLLNHGYMEDAIKTENKTFLDNTEVKQIINKMWYGTEKRNFKTILVFFVLATCHIILLPLLMITMESRPLRWFYKQYKLPFMKVCIDLLGFLSLLIAYAYMLLFDYSKDGISRTDYFIITWMVSFLFDESKQQIVAIIRNKWKCYVADWWNRLDWISILVYTTGMLLKIGERQNQQETSKVFLVVAFMLLCIRILHLFCMSEILGPKLVMIRKMFSDTIAFMTIMTVIMMCYNISFHALLYTNSEFTWSELEKITQNGYWMLFGELNLDGEKITVPDCTFNKTVYDSGALQQCPSQLGLYLVPYLKAFYGLVAVILLLNLLIAMYSNTFKEIHEKSEFYWSQLQNDFLEEYSIKTIFPIHVQLLVLPVVITHAFVWLCTYIGGKLYKKCCKDKYDEFPDWFHKYILNDDYEDEATLNRGPMFVRVFLYNTNFDLKLKSTSEAEGSGAMKSKGEIDIMETDRITKLQTQLDSNSFNIDQLNEKSDKRNLKLLNKHKETDKYLREIKTMILKRLNFVHGSLGRIEKEVSKTAKIIHEVDFNSDGEKDEIQDSSSTSDDEDSDGLYDLNDSSDIETSNDPECKMQ